MSDRDVFGSGGTMPPPSTDYSTGGTASPVAGGTRPTSMPTGATSGQSLISGQGPQASQGQGSQGSQGQGGAQMGQAKEQAGQALDTAKEKAGQVGQQATQAMDTAKDKAGQVAEQASAKADQGIDKAAGGLGQAAGLLREKTEGLGGQGGAGETAQQLAGQAAQQLDTAARYLEGKDSDQLVADLESLVRRKPTESLLVAAGVGFLLSRIVR